MEEEKKKKKAYCKPEMHVEEFTPNEYIAACYDYKGILECEYGKEARDNRKSYVIGHDGLQHGSPCSYIEIDADGVNITGKEYQKSYISIYNVNVGDFDWSTADNGVTVKDVTWNSIDGSTYYHKGTLTFTSKAEQITGRPNHS